MKKFLNVILILLLWNSSVYAEKVVHWTFDIEQKSEKNFDLKLHAEILENWHLYPQNFFPNNGTISATEILLNPHNFVHLNGSITESGGLHTEYDPVYEEELSFYENHADFTLNVSVDHLDSLIKGYVYFIACDNKQCLPYEYVDFVYDLNSQKGWIKELEVDTTKMNMDLFNRASIDTDNPLAECTVQSEKTEGKGMWALFLLGFVGGLLALLTPCVFPMIPLTVSFFTKGSKDKKKGMMNAFIYGGFIFLIYVLLSLPFHLMDQVSPDILNNISTNVWLNIFFFIIFLFFAFSFFGYYEITLPSALTNKMDSASNIGGIIGIFFMALTLALVSFSCTGPILGSLLASSLTTDGGATQLSVGMGGFGLALALPFALFAAFPGWLNSLPKSGGWLNSVKVVLGFVELALAFKFLSNADLVSHWGILKIEAFLTIWIICAIGLTLYLFGKIKFPHDSPLKKLSGLRIFLGVLSFSSVIYLFSGFRINDETRTYEPLILLSGLAPTSGYSWFHPTDCPQNFDCFKNYYEGLEYAKQVGKPILLDFTGYSCVNCRKVEETVWRTGKVKELISEDYVLISLYVDDRKEIPKNERMNYQTENYGVKRIQTVGDQWATLQTESYGNNSQPWYCLISPDEVLLTNPIGYNPESSNYVADYEEFLECGLNAYKSMGKY